MAGDRTVEEIVFKTVYDDKGLKQGVEKSTTAVKKLEGGIEQVEKRTVSADGKFKGYTKTVRRSRSEFQMWALSLLFGGMIIQRSAQQIATTTTQAFMKMERGQTEAGKSLLGVGAAFKFLQFEVGKAIGTALTPFLPKIIEISKWFGRIVQQNPGAVFGTIASAFILGAGLTLGGQIVLFANGLRDMFNEVGKSKNINNLTTFSNTLGKISSAVAGGFIISFGIQDIQEGVTEDDFNKKVIGGIEILSGGLFLAGKTKAGAAAFIVAVGFKLVADEEFRDDVASLFADISRLVVAFGTGVGKFIADAIVAPFRFLTQGISQVGSGDFVGAAASFAKASGALVTPGLFSSEKFAEGFREGGQSFDRQASQDFIRGYLDYTAGGGMFEDPNKPNFMINANTVIMGDSGNPAVDNFMELVRRT